MMNLTQIATADIQIAERAKMPWPFGQRPDNVDKAGRVTTPPMQPQKPKYGDKKIVKAVKPKKPKG